MKERERVRSGGKDSKKEKQRGTESVSADRSSADAHPSDSTVLCVSVLSPVAGT